MRAVAEVQLLIVADQMVTRSGLVAMARAAPGLNVAGEVNDADGMMSAVRDLCPDVVLLNLRGLTGPDLRNLVDQIDAKTSIIVLRSSGSRIETGEVVASTSPDLLI